MQNLGKSAQFVFISSLIFYILDVHVWNIDNKEHKQDNSWKVEFSGKIRNLPTLSNNLNKSSWGDFVKNAL